MASQKERIHMVSTAIVFNKQGKSLSVFLVKEEGDEAYGLPKTNVRNGESSVRAAIRMMAEQGGMRAKVLEEVGRVGGATKINNKIVTQRTLYYLMIFKEGSEALGFADSEWVDYTKALRKLSVKKDASMLKDAKTLLKEVEHKYKEEPEPETEAS
ncbi:NUDIX domain-containing protein [Candidatus Microgenomates bacterium]|nr:MAG: NUDIX domain-containing protein [Candidatus Microgenomates bacterium]